MEQAVCQVFDAVLAAEQAGQVRTYVETDMRLCETV
jgi:hypothetical protein